MFHIKQKIFLCLVIVLAFPLMGLSCQKQEQITLKPITLKVWGYQEDSEALSQIIKDYQQTRPQVQVIYTKFNKDEYNDKLLNALAENTGPDIFAVPVTSLRNFQAKITYLPEEINVEYLDAKGQATAQKIKSVSIKKTLNDFIDLVNNVIIMQVEERDALGQLLPVKNRIYGFPLSVDTLALYYNKDILADNKIIDPPKTWSDFKDSVQKITRLGENHKIILSGAGFGATKNVNYFSDIFAAIVLQTGGYMTDESQSSVLFNKTMQGSNSPYPPAQDAVQFYIDFASPTKETYTWNDTMPNSLEAFAQGKTAFYFGYNSDYDAIKLKNPKLPFEVSPFPQLEGNALANMAKFDILSVSKKSVNQDMAWDFLQYLVRLENMSKYLEAAKQPTALRALIVSQKQQEDRLKIFASQLLTAQIWYKGYDFKKAEDALAQMLSDVAAGKYENMHDALNFAAYEVQETLNP